MSARFDARLPGLLEPRSEASTVPKPCKIGDKVAHGSYCAIECTLEYRLTTTVSTYLCAFGQLTTDGSNPAALCTRRTCTVRLALALALSRVCPVPGLCHRSTRLQLPNFDASATAVPTLAPTFATSLKAQPTLAPTLPQLAVSLGVEGVEIAGSVACSSNLVLQLGVSCAVKCKDGFEDTDPKTGLATGFTGIFTASCPATPPYALKWPLNCAPKACRLPSAFNIEIQGGGWPYCQPGSFLPSGQTCTVSCAPGYALRSGSAEFSCDKGRLRPASLECIPKTVCALPLIFPGGTEGGTSNRNWGAATTQYYAGENVPFPNVGCINNGAVNGGSRCYVKCVQGFAATYPVGENPRSFYECAGGTLIPPNLQCKSSSYISVVVTCPAIYPFDSNSHASVLADTAAILLAPPEQVGVSAATRSANQVEVRLTVPVNTKDQNLQALAARLPNVIANINCVAGAPVLVPASCVYQKDATCFDSMYPCEACCTTNQGMNGQGCWDAVYTRFRCCKGVAATPSPSDPTTAAPVAIQSLGSLPPTMSITQQLCWDYFYPQDTCCTTGKGILGDTCWSQKFTAQKCCPPTSVLTATSSPTLYTAQLTAAPTFGCPYEKDASCFNENYPCKQCCETGISKIGAAYAGTCWDAIYSYDRCCLGGKLASNNLCTLEDSQRLIFSLDQAQSLTNLGCKACVLDCMNTFGLDRPDLRLECLARCQPQLTQASSVAVPINIFDTLDVCPAWAASGMCTTDWVQQSCPASCLKFIQISQGLRNASACIDQDVLCPTWARLGECTGGSAAQKFVQRTCKKSCNNCPGTIR
jgi:hypothetical protein